ncbi:hypothetical protein [Absidia glauca]|uniref:RING-type domain-containing protein n=1 Tax=Absidia glauca TaxID=4829 RepID=A0A163K346_ABSGL|nr:hypothetical protein [Absidia glauca]
MADLQQDPDQQQQQEQHMERALSETGNGTAINTEHEHPVRQRTLTLSSTSSSYPPDEDSDMDSSFSDAEEHQMDYWMQRCSICFDAPLDLCLEFCGDQYCNECFQRYVTEVVMSSWGLSVTTLKCPVCQEHIPQAEWSQFVPQTVVDHYDRFNQPYRSFTRCCPHCEEEAKPCDYSLREETIEQVNYLDRIRSMVESFAIEGYGYPMQLYSDDEDNNDGGDNNNGAGIDDGTDEDDYDDSDDNDFAYADNDNNDDDDNDGDDDPITQLYSPLHSLLLLLDDDCPQSSFVGLYKETMMTLLKFEQHYHQISQTNTTNKRSLVASTIHTRRRAISSLFLLLDVTPEAWKQMQFLHISYFPNTTCSNCHSDFCLQCGYGTHGKLTCEENMKDMVQSGLPQNQDVVVTAQWHLDNSQRCPNCSIMINRDEGCNKVDCSLCGFCFCWACRSPWSEKCGFYHCAMTEGSNKTSTTPPSPKHTEHTRAELGVPNISSIEARLLTSGSPLR